MFILAKILKNSKRNPLDGSTLVTDCDVLIYHPLKTSRAVSFVLLMRHQLRSQTSVVGVPGPHEDAVGDHVRFSPLNDSFRHIQYGLLECFQIHIVVTVICQCPRQLCILPCRSEAKGRDVDRIE
jgi:hypothetical protein